MGSQISKGLLGAIPFLVLAAPTLAHTVKVSEDVAATFHIDPNHNPRAGEPAQAWFVLTQAGGKMIPLTQCHCRLRVYAKPRQADSAPMLQPPLNAIAAEQHRGIPGAEIVFPQPGVYALELQGTPRSGAQFQPFTLTYDVTVIRGGASSPPTALHKHPQTHPRPSWTEAQRPEQPLRLGLAFLATVSGLGLLGLLVYRLLNRKP